MTVASRTWKAHTTYRECGVVTEVKTYVVTIARTGQSFTAEVDGQTVDVLHADRILRAADRLEVIAEQPVLSLSNGQGTAAPIRYSTNGARL